MQRKFEDDDKKKRLMIITAAIVLVIILAILISSCGRGENEDSFELVFDERAREGKTASISTEEVIEDLNKKVEEGMMNISMNLCPCFEDGQSEGNLMIYNDELNRYPQVVRIYLKDGNELIYESKAIKPGYGIEYAPLLKSLEKGEYRCIAYFDAVDEESSQCLGRAGAEIVVNVLN